MPVPSYLGPFQQSTIYKIQLLAVTHSYVVPDDQVLPYQAHVPPNELITALQASPLKAWISIDTSFQGSNPCPGEGLQPDFAEAVAPYAMAVQIGSALSGFWNLTDEWAFEYTPPRPPIPSPWPFPGIICSSRSRGRQFAQLTQSGIYANTSASHGPPSSSTSTTLTCRGPTTKYAHPGTSEAVRTYGRKGSTSRASCGTPEHYSQIRFQGLWWGAERIWVDEFIRLKVPAPMPRTEGRRNIFSHHSGPGEGARELWAASGRDMSESVLVPGGCSCGWMVCSL